MADLDADDVAALAPDATSLAAGRALASPARWAESGADASAAWGLCPGSGKVPYRTVVDVGGPAYRCSCPSRKHPCKHAIGLMLLRAGGHVPTGPPPDWAGAWLTQRAARADSAAAPATDTPPKATSPRAEAAAHRHAAEREARLAAGVAELQRWLADQVRTGLADLASAGRTPFTDLAARMVDAGAPGLAASVRELGTTVDGKEGWPDRLLEGMAMLHLTAGAHGRLEALPEGLAASVRREIGLVVPREEVLAGPAVRDVWQVLAVRTATEDRLEARRAWLLGVSSGRWAMLLTYTRRGVVPSGQAAVDASLPLGAVVEADLHFYPGSAPLRAVVGARHDDGAPATVTAPTVTGGTGQAGEQGSVARARGARAAALAADPWTRSWPAVVPDLVPTAVAPRWRARDGAGTEVALLGEAEALWKLLAVSGGHPVAVTVEVEAEGLRPLSVVADGEVVGL